MEQTIEHRHGDDFAFEPMIGWWNWVIEPGRDMLIRGEAYKELGGDYFDKRRKDVKVNVLTKQLEKLGYAVQLEPVKLQLVSA